MNRRSLLRHVTTATLLVGSSGVAGAGGSRADDLEVSFSVTGRSDSDVHDHAAVTCGGTVVITGRIVCPRPCDTAHLHEIDRHDDTLRVAIESVSDSEDCDDEPIGIDYELAVTDFEHRPKTVTVVHDGEKIQRHHCGEKKDEEPTEKPDDDHTDFEFSFDEPEDPPKFHFEDPDEPEFSFEEPHEPEFSFPEPHEPDFSFDDPEAFEFSFPKDSDDD